MRQNVLVTGGAGYIGSHTCKALSEAGYKPVVYDNFSTGHRWAVKFGPLVQGDLVEQDRLTKTMIDENIAAVIHFAADAAVTESIGNPRKYFSNNLMNSVSLLNAMIDSRVRTIVFSSSCAVYGHATERNIREEDPKVPISPYGLSKRMFEEILEWYQRAYGFNAIILRYFNAAGADPDGELGEDHSPETHLIPNVILAALGVQKDVTIYGADFPTSDGTAIRDYVHVSDLADAHVRAVKRLVGGGSPLTANLGGGRGTSVREIIAAVERHARTRISQRILPRREGEPAVLVASPGLAMRDLEWSPKQSDIERIVQTAFEWHQRSPSPKLRNSHERLLSK